MKKITLLLTLIFIITGCGSDSEKKSPKPNKQKEKTIIEGTVTQVLNYLIPSAHAQIDNDCDGLVDERLYEHLSCVPEDNLSCEGKDGERCVFLLGPEGLIAATAVKEDGTYKFELDIAVEDGKLYKLVVEDYEDKEFYREQVFDKKELTEKVEINPETTLLVEFKRELLRRLSMGDLELKDVKDALAESVGGIKELLEEGYFLIFNKIKQRRYLIVEIKRMLMMEYFNIDAEDDDDGDLFGILEFIYYYIDRLEDVEDPEELLSALRSLENQFLKEIDRELQERKGEVFEMERYYEDELSSYDEYIAYLEEELIRLSALRETSEDKEKIDSNIDEVKNILAGVKEEKIILNKNLVR